MRYFLQTTHDYISGLLAAVRPGQKLLLTFPEMPAAVTLAIAETLANDCLSRPACRLQLKIAQAVTQGWSEAERATARQHDWLEDRGNLTYYRNLPPQPEFINFIVLCGVDRVIDASGLADFECCDSETLWKRAMRQSFGRWLQIKLDSSSLLSGEANLATQFDRILKPLLDLGQVSLWKLSQWLENLEVNDLGSLKELQRRMLDQMQGFGLPKLGGFVEKPQNTKLKLYLESAVKFFDGHQYLDNNLRTKNKKSLDELRTAYEEQDLLKLDLNNPELRGPYANALEFLNGLERYITEDSASDRQKLLECDYIFIHEKVFKFRAKKNKTTKEGLQKIQGNPVEVFLQAIWKTFSQFYLKYNNEEAQPQSIEIVYDHFKFDAEANASDASEGKEQALEYLQRWLGGVGELLQDHLDLEDESGQKLPVSCRLVDSEIKVSDPKTAEPYYAFRVIIHRSHQSEPQFACTYAWRLPDHHPYRLTDMLLCQAAEEFNAMHEGFLPVFHLEDYEELLRLTSEEEVQWVLLHALRNSQRTAEHPFAQNLLSGDWLSNTEDPLRQPLETLGRRYTSFLQEAHAQGWHKALFYGNAWNLLTEAYKACCAAVSSSQEAHDSTLAGMLLRCFLVIRRRSASEGNDWYAYPYEASAMVTALHPALLEMWQAQISYLFSCFNHAFREAWHIKLDKPNFRQSIWQRYADLSSLQAPLPGLLHNSSKNLSVLVRGKGLFHRMGSLEATEAALSTRAIFNYEEDEEVSDTELFSPSSESELLTRLMIEYVRLHPHARDGLRLAVFRNQEVQPVIAAVHHFLGHLAREKLDKHKPNPYYVLYPNRRIPYAVSVTLFTESSDDSEVANWLDQWRERWLMAETENKFRHYRECSFSLAHRLVEQSRDEEKGHDQSKSAFARIVQAHLEADLAVLYDFIGFGHTENSFLESPAVATAHTLKFPLLEKISCAKQVDKQLWRSRILGYRQFSLARHYTDLLSSLHAHVPRAETLIVGRSNYKPWRSVVDSFHAKAQWVVCIDPNIDEHLIKSSSNFNHKAREIIGFSSGVGSHGQANFTLSTEQCSLEEIKVRLRPAAEKLFAHAGWESSTSQVLTESLIAQAQKLSGLSLVRATGLNDRYLHEFMAFALTRQLLRSESLPLCDHLLSLDDYHHWFEAANDRKRPDLLWLRAYLDEEQTLRLQLHLIECKVAEDPEKFYARAKAQIENGLFVLQKAFMPRSVEDFCDDQRPDQRYWWMQLHRLVASTTAIPRPKEREVLAALEKLAEGHYLIEWKAYVQAYACRPEEVSFQRMGRWLTGLNQDVWASIYRIDSQFVQKLVLQPSQVLPWSQWESQTPIATTNVMEQLADTEWIEDDEDDLAAEDSFEEEEQEEEQEEEKPPATLTEADVFEGDESGLAEDELGQGFPGYLSPLAQEIPVSPSLSAQEAPASQSLSASNFPALSQSPTASVTSAAVGLAAPAGKRVLLGHSLQNRPIYWEFDHPKLANRHLLIFGTSGMGKTYAIQCLLCELARQAQHSLVLDYTDGFLPSKIEPAAQSYFGEQRFIQIKPLPINPFKAQVSYEAGNEFRDSPSDVARRVAAIFKSVYDLGSQQFPVLIDAITEGIQTHGEDFAFPHLKQILQSYLKNDLHTKNSVRTTLTKLTPFIDFNPFLAGASPLGWHEVFSQPEAYNSVFQFHKVDPYSARAVIEFILWDLYAHVVSFGKKESPKVIVLDEVQNLDHNDGSPLAKYLTEGRKFGLALMTATQSLRALGGSKDVRVTRLFQSAQKLFFRPTDNDMREYAQLLHDAIPNTSVADWATKLSTLQKGECLAIGAYTREAGGTLESQAVRIKITSLEERGFSIPPEPLS